MKKRKLLLVAVLVLTGFFLTGPGVRAEDKEETSPAFTELLSFRASPQEKNTLLVWETISESTNLGFNLYFDDSPPDPYHHWQKINDRLIASLVPPGSEEGAVYQFLHKNPATKTAYYLLEDIDVGGSPDYHFVEPNFKIISFEAERISAEQIIVRVIPEYFIGVEELELWLEMRPWRLDIQKARPFFVADFPPGGGEIFFPAQNTLRQFEWGYFFYLKVAAPGYEFWVDGPGVKI